MAHDDAVLVGRLVGHAQLEEERTQLDIVIDQLWPDFENHFAGPDGLENELIFFKEAHHFVEFGDGRIVLSLTV
ncbi:MAG: hypothetical protein ACD_62C00273G0002 [uncultured bacterium]|nr:MAG: hypothetical protein ACD_62C00273G0002 [uncultured bacterium]